MVAFVLICTSSAIQGLTEVAFAGRGNFRALRIKAAVGWIDPNGTLPMRFKKL